MNPTGWDAPFYAHIQGIERHLNRLANVAEAWWDKERDRGSILFHPVTDELPNVEVPPAQMGLYMLWKAYVDHGKTILGFTDWLAWRESDQSEVTTPEDIEAMGPAIAAVKRGFESMEQAVQAQREGQDDA